MARFPGRMYRLSAQAGRCFPATGEATEPFHYS